MSASGSSIGLQSSSASFRFVLILAGSWLLFFGLGVHGFWRDGYQTWDEMTFRSLQLFHLHFHRYHESHPPHHGESIHAIPLSLQIARFGAGFWALAIFPAALGWVFSDGLSRWWARLTWSGHVVVCGHCSRTLSLIADLRGKRVIFIGRCPSPKTELPTGVVFLEGGEHDQITALLGQAAVHRAATLIALNEDDRTNLEILIAANQLCRKRRASLGALECHAHLKDSHLKSGLSHLMARQLERLDHLRPRLFNYYEIAARVLACGFPLPESLVERRPSHEHYVIVGFGSFGQNVALKLIKMGQQLLKTSSGFEVVRPRITVVDPRAKIELGQFLRAHPTVQDLCDGGEISVIEHTCESAEFLDLKFVGQADPGSKISVIFCLEREELTLRCALLLRDHPEAAANGLGRIYLRLAHSERLEGLVERLPGEHGKPAISLFAPDREIFSADAILRQSLDVLADELHKGWLRIADADARANNVPTAAGKSWDELSEQDRDSNRESADHLWAKLRALGYQLERVPAGEIAPPVDEKLIAGLLEHEDTLARAEHYRWLTWRLLNGWKHGPQRDERAMLHPDIVPYEELAAATREKDKVSTRAIPGLLKTGQLRAVRVSPEN